MKLVSIAPIEQIPIDEIAIGVRRREKLGRLQALARSIKDHGLVHPIFLRGRTLVAGHRRLEACRSLGWASIPARQVQRLTDEELRAIELEENTEREALTDYAASKARLGAIRQAEADLKAKADLRVDSTQKPRARGRPKKGSSVRAIEKETGINTATQRQIERHVEIAERYPFMQRPPWVQHTVLEAGIALEKLPERDRGATAALLDGGEIIAPKTAIAMIENLAGMSADDRAGIFTQAKSANRHERMTALDRAAALPPPVDPGLTLLRDAEGYLRRAAKHCHSERMRPRLSAAAHDVKQILVDFQEENANVRRSFPGDPAPQTEGSEASDHRTLESSRP